MEELAQMPVGCVKNVHKLRQIYKRNLLFVYQNSHLIESITRWSSHIRHLSKTRNCAATFFNYRRLCYKAYKTVNVIYNQKNETIMRTFVLSTLISVAALGNSVAATPPDVSDKSKATVLKETAAFHQYNMEILYSQYDLAETQIKTSRGNHAELDREHKFFVGLYQEDIDKGIRVEQSKKAISEINARYAKLHAERDAQEAKKIGQLQKQLEVALKKEEIELNKVQRALSQV